MKVYNKSSIDQKFHINDRYGNTYVVYIKAGRSTELEPSQVSDDVLNLISKGVLVDITDGNKPVISVSAPNDVSPVNDQSEEKSTNVDIECACEDENKETTETAEVEEETVVTEEETVVTEEEQVSTESEETVEDTEPSVEDVEPSPDTFVCKICGKEYATQRGLTMHTNKEHKED